jgi:signal peptidase I
VHIDVKPNSLSKRAEASSPDKPSMTLYLANPDVRYHRRETNESAVLVNPDTGAILGINPTSRLLWQALGQPCTRDQLGAHLSKHCTEQPLDQICADVDAFLQTLLEKGFIGKVLDPGVPGFGYSEGLVNDKSREKACEPENTSSDISDEGLRPFYRGLSMLGTFLPGDQLIIEPVPMAAILPGDVVVFRQHVQTGPQNDVVHRVRAFSPDGLVTQGDANQTVDRQPVTQDRLLGRVTHRIREGQVRPVAGGLKGRMHLQVLQTRRLMRRSGAGLIKAVARGPYSWLRQSGLVRRLWRPVIWRVQVMDNCGPLVKYTCGHHSIAWWRPGTIRFWCRRPYDLLISPPYRRQPVTAPRDLEA